MGTEGESKNNNKHKKQNKTNLPLTGEFNLGGVVAGSTAVVLLHTQINLFFSVETRIGELSRRPSSIFPFDARSGFEIDFSLYSRLSSFRDSVTPVRRREDTEGNRDTGVKVQID